VPLEALDEPARPRQAAKLAPRRRLFYDDYDRFYRSRTVQRRGNPAPDRDDIGEPLKVAYLFAEKRTGHVAGP
jgi:hypothetical protein